MLVSRASSWAVLGFMLAGCPIDDRQLSPEVDDGGTGSGAHAGSGSQPGVAGSMGGSGRAGGAGAGGSGQRPAEGGSSAGDGDGGEAAASAGGSAMPGAPPMVGGCVDLNQDGVGDCRQTMLENASFRYDLNSWNADGNVELIWVDQNAFSDLPSGAGKLAAVFTSDSPSSFTSGFGQCVRLSGTVELEIFLNAFIPKDQGAGSVVVQLIFFEQEGCLGQEKSSFMLTEGRTDAWNTVSGKRAVEEGVGAMLVRLTVRKPFTTPRFEALFDNVLIVHAE